MTFNFIKLPELNFNLEATMTESGRQYKTPTGNVYPSVTTVLSDYNKKEIFEWRQRVGETEANKISTRSSARGTKLHSICEKYLLNEDLGEVMPDTKELFRSIKPYMNNSIGNVYAVEQSLYSDTLKIAGRVDCIAEWDGQLAVIDFKTSSRQKEEGHILNYFMQCSAYAEMFSELTNKPIGRVIVLIAVEQDIPQLFVRNKDDYLPHLNKYIERFYNKSA